MKWAILALVLAAPASYGPLESDAWHSAKMTVAEHCNQFGRQAQAVSFSFKTNEDDPYRGQYVVFWRCPALPKPPIPKPQR